MTTRCTLVVVILLCAPHASGAQTPGVPPTGIAIQGSATGTGIIRGRITRTDGRPLARVFADLRGNNVRFRASGLTDDEGRFYFTDLPPGSFTLVAHKSGYVELEFGQKRTGESGTPIVLSAGATQEKIDLTLPRGSAIAGRIVDEDGDPVEGATVQVQRMRFGNGTHLMSPAPARAQLTDDAGRYRVYGLPPGTYYVSASLDAQRAAFTVDPARHPPAYYPGATSPSDAQPVVLGLSQSALDIDFTLPPTPTPTVHVSGVVLDPSGLPFTGAAFLGLSQRSHAVQIPPERATLGPGGQFDFPNVVPGNEYTLQAFTQAQSAFAMQFVAVPSTSVTGLELHASDGYSITGRVTLDGDASTVKPSQVSFGVLPTDFDRAPIIGNGGPRGTVHDDWTFDVAHLFGPRRVVMNVASNWTIEALRVAGIDVTDLPIESDARNSPLADVEIILTDHAAQVSGTVADARRQPVTDYSVLVFATDRERWFRFSRYLKSARPGQDGTFSVPDLPPGTYFVAAVDHTEGAVGGDEWQDPQLLETLAPLATRVVVAEGQHLTVTPTLIVRDR